ncbi:hypothetical protein L7F22_047651 [Adiantum nelumboides]|nr:hypothetical protein [Adiantum nelumboides]
MKGMAEGSEQRAVLRWGMRRVVLVSAAMVCSMLAVALSTDTLSFLSGNSAHRFRLISSVLSSKNSMAPRSSAMPTSSSPLSTLPRTQPSATSIGCDYTVGSWVKSEKLPLYSGSSCKKWLSGMWACRLMPGRPNFNYENVRWQPNGCNLPEFNSEDFLARMQNKVVAFVGDSIGRQQYQSLMCMLTGGDDEALVEDVSKVYGLVKPRGAIRADGTAQRFMKFNTTVIYYWSASLCELQPLNRSDPNTYYAMHLDRPATFIQTYLKLMDVLILNTGHHWNRGKLQVNKWVMNVDGKPNSNEQYERVITSARDFTVRKVAAWLHKQKENGRTTRAEVYIRSLFPRHFFNGEWDSGGRCDDDFIPLLQHNVTGSDPAVESAISGTSLRLLNITYVSQFRYDAHVSKYWRNQSGQDCLHWCLPGVPDVWNELLYADILSRATR